VKGSALTHNLFGNPRELSLSGRFEYYIWENSFMFIVGNQVVRGHMD
jgi:hypothetical protein